MPRKKAEASPEEKAVDVLGQLTVILGGVEYLLRPSRQAISNIERATGKALTELATMCGSLALSIEDLGVCVCEFLRAYAAHDPNAGADYRGANPARMADLVYESGPVDVMRRVAVVLVGALTGGYTASGEVKAVETKTTEPTPTAK